MSTLLLDHVPYLALQGMPGSSCGGWACEDFGVWVVGSGRCGHPCLTAVFVPRVLTQVFGQPDYSQAFAVRS